MSKETPEIIKWLERLDEDKKKQMKMLLPTFDKEGGMEFISFLIGRPITEAEYLLVLSELGLKKSDEDKKRRRKKSSGENMDFENVDWDKEIKWLYGQIKERIQMGRHLEEDGGVPLPSVDKMIEVASKLIEISLKYKESDKDLYAFLGEVLESEDDNEGSEESE